MPAPRIDDSDLDDEDSGQKALRAARAVLAQSGDIGERYGATILAALALFGVLYFWLVVLPKPLAVTLVVTEADTNATITGAQVEADYLASPYMFTSVRTSRAIPGTDGRYALRDVPSNTNGISVRVRKAPDYESRDVLISTGDSPRTVQVQLYKNTQLRIERGTILGSIAPSCAKSFNVPVYNNDTENDLEALLVATGLPSFETGKTTIAAGAASNVSFSIMTNYPDSDKNPASIWGSVRISGTNEAANVNITLTRATSLSRSPSEIRLKVGNTQLVEIKNNGKGAITRVRLSMDDSSRRIIALVGLREDEEFDLAPSQTKTAYATAVAEGIGIVTVSADCTAPQELPVKVTAE
jgi:hypothetical protein